VIPSQSAAERTRDDWNTPRCLGEFSAGAVSTANALEISALGTPEAFGSFRRGLALRSFYDSRQVSESLDVRSDASAGPQADQPSTKLHESLDELLLTTRSSSP